MFQTTLYSWKISVLNRCHHSGRDPGREVGGPEWTLQCDTLLPPWQLELAIQRNKWPGANVGGIRGWVPPTWCRLQIRAKVRVYWCCRGSVTRVMFIRIMSCFFSVLVYLNGILRLIYSHRSLSLARGNGPNFPYLDFVFFQAGTFCTCWTSSIGMSWTPLLAKIHSNRIQRRNGLTVTRVLPISMINGQCPLVRVSKLEGHGFTSFSPFWAFIWMKRLITANQSR